uniref:NADH dehydrogenase subunit 4L n=1 Tax=Trocnadella arisana TaxID=1437250 RepID=A0A342KAG8_9HEMI|nr:NADH dehydrogenase subunit 4L [Trocnadella arisana]AMY96202.1 NADH dehydrogenase subunit 4L [Trocnadella arisana]
MNYFFLYIYFMSLLSLVMFRKHILLCLMMLEFMVISLLILIYFYFLLNYFSMYMYISFMCFFVCEAVLGLSSLVYFIRFFGNNYLNSFYMW